MKKTIAIYPGSFNPFTVGHQNILEKAERVFDEVILAIGLNPDKVKSLTPEVIAKLSQEEIDNTTNKVLESKLSVLKQQLPSKNFEGYTSFLTDYVREKEAKGYNVVIIRGLRNGHDFDYEYNQIRFMWDQMPMLNIMCLFADPMFMHVSSSAYRALEKVRSGSGHKYLASEVEKNADGTTKIKCL
jgi:pantetheine-phosphate adenylyltransferase